MKAYKPFDRVILKILGGLFVLGSLTISYWWFYKMAPTRHLVNPEWRANASERALWLEELKNYERTGAVPDLVFRSDKIGYYGEKEHFLWLMDRMNHGEEWDPCGCTEYVLALMANQEILEGQRKTWVELNKNRAQEEWIKDGFTNYHIQVHLPPEASDIEPLLGLLGRKTWDFWYGGPQGTNASRAVPNYVQYNAFRWLRDSGFHTMAFALTNASVKTSDVLKAGLVNYSGWERKFPTHNQLGVLAFGKKAKGTEGEWSTPRILEPWFILTVYTLIIGSFILGIVLMFLPRRKQCEDPGKRATPTDSEAVRVSSKNEGSA